MVFCAAICCSVALIVQFRPMELPNVRWHRRCLLTGSESLALSLFPDNDVLFFSSCNVAQLGSRVLVKVDSFDSRSRIGSERSDRDQLTFMEANNESNSLKILLVDDSQERAAALILALRTCGYENVSCANTADVLSDQNRLSRSDIILIDVESPTRDTLEQLTLIRDRQPKPVVLFTQDENVQSIQAAIQSGVSAYVLDGISPSQVRPAIEIAMATFQSFQSLRAELDEARSSLEDQKTVNRAKGILMEKRRLSEEAAYQFLRKAAMDRKRKMADVARDIIALKDLIA